MTTITLTAWGKSLGLRVPKEVAESNGWKAGDKIQITEQDGGVFLKKPRRIKKYDIEELLAGVEEFKAEDMVDFGPPVGREVW